MFLKNCWYVAAYDRELEDGGPLGRKLLDEPVVIFRDSKGTPVALEDRCCHRQLPLSLGTVTGDTLQCGYHGLEFDATGACVTVPGQSMVPPGAVIRSYPLVEKWGFLWIWMGDAAQADEAPARRRGQHKQRHAVRVEHLQPRADALAHEELLLADREAERLLELPRLLAEAALRFFFDTFARTLFGRYQLS